jgi:hypothetical protein
MIEADYNPFILFSQEGKVISLNKSAQFLLGSVTAKVLFEHTLNYATTSFGFKTTHIDLSFGHFHFFALNVGYETEDELGVMFYRKPSMEQKIDSTLQSPHDPINIYSVIDLCISATSIGLNRNITRDFDPTLPDVRINTSEFIKMFSTILTSSRENADMTIKLALKVGEHLKIDGKKYSIFEILVSSSENFMEDEKYSIEKKSEKLGATLYFEAKKISIEMAIIS